MNDETSRPSSRNSTFFRQATGSFSKYMTATLSKFGDNFSIADSKVCERQKKQSEITTSPEFGTETSLGSSMKVAPVLVEISSPR